MFRKKIKDKKTNGSVWELGCTVGGSEDGVRHGAFEGETGERSRLDGDRNSGDITRDQD